MNKPKDWKSMTEAEIKEMFDNIREEIQINQTKNINVAYIEALLDAFEKKN